MISELNWFNISVDGLVALADKDLKRAEELLGIRITAYFITDEAVRLWNRRLKQIEQDMRTLDWIAQIAAIRGQAIGHAGFHGVPDTKGMVELAYSVDRPYRRRGFATAMVSRLIERANLDPEVKIIRATIRPDNVVSLATLKPFSFTQNGEQWDEEDGLELIFERTTTTHS